MLNWKILDSIQQLDELVAISDTKPVLIFKHSTRCSISSVAKNRLETKWDFSDDVIVPYYLDLLAYRSISDEIASKFNVHHESPQIILLQKGDVILDESHLDITVEGIKEQLKII